MISNMNRPPDSRAGFTLLSRLRNVWPDTPYIIYAAPVAPELQAETWKRGALGITDRPHDLVLFVLEAVASKSEPKAA